MEILIILFVPASSHSYRMVVLSELFITMFFLLEMITKFLMNVFPWD